MLDHTSDHTLTQDESYLCLFIDGLDLSIRKVLVSVTPWPATSAQLFSFTPKILVASTRDIEPLLYELLRGFKTLAF